MHRVLAMQRLIRLAPTAVEPSKSAPEDSLVGVVGYRL